MPVAQTTSRSLGFCGSPETKHAVKTEAQADERPPIHGSSQFVNPQQSALTRVCYWRLASDSLSAGRLVTCQKNTESANGCYRASL